MSDVLWLNVGSGDFPAPQPWVNIDSNNDRCTPDVVGSILDLPYDTWSVDRIYAGHVLEHIPILRVVDALRECLRVLKNDGVLVCVGPDVRAALEHLKDRRLSWEEYGDMLYGGQRWNGDTHQWACTGNVVEECMVEAGFVVRALDVTPQGLEGWPVVAYTTWQYAFEGRLT